LRTRAAAPPPDDEASAVRVERLDDRLVITLDRPARHNAFSARMRDELYAALQIAEAEPRLAVVLRGAGASFSSGGDLDEFGTTPDPATAHLVRTTRSPARALAAVAARVRAEVHGACIGAGIELAALAGTVVARPDAFFELPEIAMGLIPGAGGTATIPRRIGCQRTAWLALTGCRLDAATALAWGLIDAIDEAARIP
jgi:enoyl-CoA hydratase/carnithine racemase